MDHKEYFEKLIELEKEYEKNFYVIGGDKSIPLKKKIKFLTEKRAELLKFISIHYDASLCCNNLL